MTDRTIVKGSLHSHGCWTDYYNPIELARFPFNLQRFAELCLSCGRDFQAVTDIMANWPGKPEFVEHRYADLLKTADPKASYYLQAGKRESIIHLPGGRKFFIPRSQEILTNTNFKHILAVGAEEDVRGGEEIVDVLRKIRDLGGYAIIDHPFMCDAWTEEEIQSLYERELIGATEWNGGLTFPKWTDHILRKVPSKLSNERALKLEQKTGISVIANDDSHCEGDIKRGAYTIYSIENSNSQLVACLFDAIKEKSFEREEKYSPFLSPIKHVVYGQLSQRLFGSKGLPNA